MAETPYVNVDQLQADTRLAEAAARCGVSLEAKEGGDEVRLDCPFGCPGDHVGRREISVNTANPQKVFCCHAYGCQFRGNLLTLMHGWLSGARPTGGKLKGDEFNRVKRVLAHAVAPPVPAACTAAPAESTAVPATDPLRNVPLMASDQDKVRELATLDDKLIVDVASMAPKAAAYLRRHPALTREALQKWRCGYLPQDGGGDKRGWSLRGHILYPVLSEQGQVLAWVGRNVDYEEQERAFSVLTPAARQAESPPIKHRFPKGFQRGQELFGQQAARLQEPGYRPFISQHGLIVVEGFNDVMGLDNLGVPAVALMSNRLTEAQVSKLVRFARQLAGGKIVLLLDCDAPGDDGAKEALWLLSQAGLNVHLAWSRGMHAGHFQGRQPESLNREELAQLLRPSSPETVT